MVLCCGTMMRAAKRKKLIKVLGALETLLVKCGGPGGTMGPCPAGGGKKLKKDDNQHTEAEIRHRLETDEGRDHPYQKARQVELPEDWKLQDMPRAKGIGTGPQSECFKQSLKKAKEEGYELFAGAAVEKKDMLQKDDPPDAFVHAWVVKDGKIHDFVLGSKRSSDFYYLGKKLDASQFENAEALSKHIRGQIQ